MATYQDYFDKIAWEWACRSFGKKHMMDPQVRAARFLEEAVELVQAIGLDKTQAQKVLDIVYSRPAGNTQFEVGGVQMTFMTLCKALNIDRDYYFYMELSRVLEYPTEHFTKRNQQKMDLGLTGHVEEPAAQAQSNDAPATVSRFQSDDAHEVEEVCPVCGVPGCMRRPRHTDPMGSL